MGRIFVLALAAAVYPTLLAGVIVILTRPNPTRQLTAFLVGGMSFSVCAGLLLLGAAQESPQLRRDARSASPAVDLVLGALSLTVALAIATGRPRRLAAMPARPRHREIDRPSRTKQVLVKGSTPLTVALGALLNLPGLWYLAALKQIAVSDYSTAGEVALVVAFNLIMFLLVELPLAAYVISPERSRAAVAGFTAWLREHRRQAAAGIAATVGAYLVLKGLTAALD